MQLTKYGCQRWLCKATKSNTLDSVKDIPSGYNLYLHKLERQHLLLAIAICAFMTTFKVWAIKKICMAWGLFYHINSVNGWYRAMPISIKKLYAKEYLFNFSNFGLD